MYKILVVTVLILTVGCSYKAPFLSSKPYYVIIKNSQIAVADTGFMNKNNKRINLQLFSAATPILNLDIKNNICLDYVCVSRETFNEKFFGYLHYDDFINNLLNFKPIYDKKNLQITKMGFEQKITTDKFSIIYIVKEENLYFKDKKNRVLIKLEELK
ncbi:MAG: hypothetical protein JJV95_03430 [Sulfurospirillum sp.]|nr:hypothetical protein [Sulfurospirillum sp.]